MSTLSADDWRRVAAIFEIAVEQPSVQRQQFVRRACGSDGVLRRAVESLLVRDRGEIPADPTPPVSEPATPLQVGRYRLIEPIGRGGMNQVYVAERRDDTAQRVAIKLIDPPYSANALRMFDRESTILARLEHPAIARFLDRGVTEDGTRFVAMELVEGAPLLDYCDARCLHLDQRLQIFLEICSAVHHAHQNLVVHRDLKPQNVLVTDEGRPKLLDFGIAKFFGTPLDHETTARSDRFLTPGYASPEQLSGAPVNTASDIYSLGLFLHELLVGCHPFDPQDLLRHGGLAVRRRGPRPPSVDARQTGVDDGTTPAADRARARRVTPARLQRQLRGDLDTIVRRCVQFEPAARYSSVERLAADIRRHRAGLPIHARKPSLGYRIGKFVHRNVIAVAASTLAMCALAALLVSLLSQNALITRERDNALTAQREAEEVTRVLTDLFRLPDPYRNGDGASEAGSDLTAQHLLAFAREKVESELAAQPLLQARLMSNLGQVYVNLGLIDDGLALLDASLAARRRMLGDRHPEIATSLRHIGSALFEAGRVEQAEPMLRRSLALAQRLTGNKAVLAESLSAAAKLQMHHGDFEGAEVSFREALSLRRAAGQSESRPYGRDLSNLGWALWLAKNHDEAALVLEESLALLLRVVGESHPDIATVQHHLAWVYARRGNVETAEDLFRSSLALRRRLQGPEHPETLASLAALGTFYVARGEPASAEPILREVLVLERRLKGDKHPDIAIDLYTLGLAVWDRGDLSAAEALVREAFTLATEVWGPDYRGTITYQRSWGQLLLAIGETDAAATLIEEALARARANFGAAHRYTGITLSAWAEVLLQTGHQQEALAEAEQALAIISAALPADSWRVGQAKSVLGACLTAVGRLEAAETTLQEGLVLLEKSHRLQLIRATLHRLIALHEASDRPQVARRLGERLAAMTDSGPLS